MTVSTTYYVRLPSAFEAGEIALEDAEEADELARQGMRVRAVTRRRA